jgi:hypothetical protein
MPGFEMILRAFSPGSSHVPNDLYPHEHADMCRAHIPLGVSSHLRDKAFRNNDCTVHDPLFALIDNESRSTLVGALSPPRATIKAADPPR